MNVDRQFKYWVVECEKVTTIVDHNFSRQLLQLQKLGHFSDIVHGHHGELLVELELGLGQAREIDDHQQVPQVAVQHRLELDRVHLGHGLDQIDQGPAHGAVWLLLSSQHRLNIPADMETLEKVPFLKGEKILKIPKSKYIHHKYNVFPQ